MFRRDDNGESENIDSNLGFTSSEIFILIGKKFEIAYFGGFRNVSKKYYVFLPTSGTTSPSHALAISFLL